MARAHRALLVLFFLHICTAHSENEIAACNVGDGKPRECMSGDGMLQHQSSKTVKVVRNVPSTRSNRSAPSWVHDKDITFMDFRVLCSHNTYMSGDQRAYTSHYNLLSALDLGYRCVELDVYPTSSKSDLWRSAGKNLCSKFDHKSASQSTMVAGYMYVNHGGTKVWASLDKIDLAIMLGGINEWLMKDEERLPASQESPKFPLIISMDAYVKDHEAQLANILNCFWSDRLLRDQQLPKLAMSSLISTSGKRKIILRATKASTNVLLKHLALDNDKVSKTYSNTKSFEAYRWTSEGLASWYKSYKKFPKKGIARVYPHKLNGLSENYDPYPALRDGVQLVCVNIQGKCPNDAFCFPYDTDFYTPVAGGTNPGSCIMEIAKDHAIQDLTMAEKGYKCRICRCNRQGAIQVEHFFYADGYDGYMPLSTSVPQSVKVYATLTASTEYSWEE